MKIKIPWWYSPISKKIPKYDHVHDQTYVGGIIFPVMIRTIYKMMIAKVALQISKVTACWLWNWQKQILLANDPPQIAPCTDES